MPVKEHLKIMLADDDEDDRELFSEAVKASLPEAELRTTIDGNALMHDLANQPADELPDILLLDLNMPIKNGKECLSEIRADKRLQRIPVIIYSTSGNQEQIDEMYEQGADYYIRKPSSFAVLKNILTLIGSMPWSGHQTPDKENFVLQNV